MKSNNSKDAIGNDIELGHVYGFTVDNVGMCYVTIGEALNFTNSGLVTLRVMKKSYSYSTGQVHDYELESKINKVSAKPCKMFPIFYSTMNEI